MKFKDMNSNVVFVDEKFGGLWRKIDADQAVCLQDDSAYKAGEVAIFQSWEECIPTDKAGDKAISVEQVRFGKVMLHLMSQKDWRK